MNISLQMLVWFIGVVVTVTLAYAGLTLKIDTHTKETTELVAITREMCYGLLKHSGLDPRPCFDSQARNQWDR